uniref:Zinc finger protein n=1 Tax=Ciona savignyi TaxID=51511 RepID=H2Y7A9_CIOSA
QRDGLYTDVRIEVGGRTWDCHRCVLAASSNHLHSILRDITDRGYVGSVPSVRFPDYFHIEDVDLILNICYFHGSPADSASLRKIYLIAMPHITKQCLSCLEQLIGADELEDVVSSVDELVSSLPRLEVQDGRDAIVPPDDVINGCVTPAIELAAKEPNLTHHPTHTGGDTSATITHQPTTSRAAKLKTKAKKLYDCSLCGKSFKRKSDLVVHDRRLHSTKPFKCSVCCKSFALDRELRIHTRIHTDGYAYKCASCGKTFTSAEGHRRHNLLMHEARTLSCGNIGCHVKFATRQLLEAHTASCPMGSTPPTRKFQCDVCGRAFRWAHLMRRHHNSVHLRAKQHQCAECARAFNRPEQLQQHLTTHTDERKYKCDDCGKSFRQKAGLFVHRRTHNSGELICEVCGYSCHSNSVLQVHIRSHTNDEVFKCGNCNKSYKTMKSLKRHIKQHQMIE